MTSHTSVTLLLQLLLVIYNTYLFSAFIPESSTYKTLSLRKMSVDSNEKYLTLITPDQVKLEIKDPVDPTALVQAKDIIKELRTSSDESILKGTINPAQLMKVGKKLGDLPEDSTSYIATKEECKTAFDGLNDVERKSLINIHARVLAFATAQRKSVQDCEIDIPGGKAGHTVNSCSGKYISQWF
jgi:hypothetical protein